MACQSCSGTRSSVVVMAADHAHDQSEQQEPAKGQKHALRKQVGIVADRLTPFDFGGADGLQAHLTPRATTTSGMAARAPTSQPRRGRYAGPVDIAASAGPLCRRPQLVSAPGVPDVACPRWTLHPRVMRAIC